MSSDKVITWELLLEGDDIPTPPPRPSILPTVGWISGQVAEDAIDQLFDNMKKTITIETDKTPGVFSPAYWRQFISEMIESIKNLGNKVDEDTEEKIDQLFGGFKGKICEELDNIRDKVKEDVRELPPEQQKIVLLYWTQVGCFINRLMPWLKRVFYRLLNYVKKGCEFVETLAYRIFQPFLNLASDIWGFLNN